MDNWLQPAKRRKEDSDEIQVVAEEHRVVHKKKAGSYLFLEMSEIVERPGFFKTKDGTWCAVCRRHGANGVFCSVPSVALNIVGEYLYTFSS
jgi:hypothetical protein